MEKISELDFIETIKNKNTTYVPFADNKIRITAQKKGLYLFDFIIDLWPCSYDLNSRGKQILEEMQKKHFEKIKEAAKKGLMGEKKSVTIYSGGKTYLSIKTFQDKECIKEAARDFVELLNDEMNLQSIRELK